MVSLFFLFFESDKKSEKSLKLENTKKETSFSHKSFAVERGPTHFFGSHENDGTFEF